MIKYLYGVSNLLNMSNGLSYPFNYYWKKYLEGKCPFCGSDIEYTMENGDIIYCSHYGGYLVIYQDAAFAGDDDLGDCRDCVPMDPLRDGFSKEGFESEENAPWGRKIVEGDGFLCEVCHHGVDFRRQVMFQELFTSHDENNCKHCKWHNDHSSNNPVEKPGN